MVRASFISPRLVHVLRLQIRFRQSFIRQKSSISNHLHNELECANIRLGFVASDIRGKSSMMAIVKHLLDSPDTLIDALLSHM